MGEEHRNIGILDHIDITGFDIDEFLNIRMVYAQGLHVGATAAMLSNGIGIFRKKVHKASRAAGYSTRTVDDIARRAQG